jgi:hypothetical protein
MSAKDKAIELVDTYRIMLMNSDTECGEEILCTLIAKSCALIAVDEIVKSKKLEYLFTKEQISYMEYTSDDGWINEKFTKYWKKVKKEIQLL